MLTGVEAGLLAIMLLGLMLGVGCTLSLVDFGRVARKPFPIAIGLASQLVVMPVLALALGKALALPPPVALGLLFVACTPGGTLSNVFTYFARGNVALSVALTTASSLVAVPLMPINLWLYGEGLAGTELVIPYGTVAASLAFVLVPIAAGMAIRARSDTLAKRIERIASRVATVALLAMAALWAPTFWRHVSDSSTASFVAIVVLALAGFGFGFGAATLGRLAMTDRKTVAIETGIQNTALTFGVISLSFPAEQALSFSWVPLVYGASTLVSASAVTLGLRRIVGPSKSIVVAEPQGGSRGGRGARSR